MISSLRKLVANPARYVPLVIARIQKLVVPMFARSAFFMQGQMDIHPRSLWHNERFTEETGGFFLPNDPVARRVFDLEPWDTVRRDMLVLQLRSIVERRIVGDMAEVGVWKGATARLFHQYLPERPLHLFDTFAGFDKRDMAAERMAIGFNADEQVFTDTTVNAVLRTIAPRNDLVKCYAGYFPETIPPEFVGKRFAFVHLDADLYAPIMAGLQYFYERVTTGGIIIVHDYNSWPGARQAVTEFFRDKPEIPVAMPDKSGSALIVKR